MNSMHVMYLLGTTNTTLLYRFRAPPVVIIPCSFLQLRARERAEIHCKDLLGLTLFCLSLAQGTSSYHLLTRRLSLSRISAIWPFSPPVSVSFVSSNYI